MSTRTVSSVSGPKASRAPLPARLLIAFLAAATFLSCTQAISGGALLRVENNTADSVVLRYGDWNARQDSDPATPAIPPGKTLSQAMPALDSVNLWYEYSDAAAKHLVRLVEAGGSVTYRFRFKAGGNYRLILNQGNFEYYEGANLIVGPGSGAVVTPDPTPVPVPTPTPTPTPVKAEAPAISAKDATGTGVSAGSITTRRICTGSKRRRSP